MAASFDPLGVGRLLHALNHEATGPTTGTGVARLRHPKWGPCELIRIEGIDWIVRVDSTGILFRVRPEGRGQFEVIRDTPQRPPEEPVAPAPRLPVKSIDARRARRAIESLRVGLPSLDGTTRQLAVGFNETESLIRTFLKDIDNDGGGAMILKGEYGQGKTFSLIVLEEIARDLSFVTARTEIDATENRLNKPQHIYRDLMRTLRLPDADGSGTQLLAEKTVDLLDRECPGNAADRQRWLHSRIDCDPLAWLLSDPKILSKPHLLGILRCDPNYPVAWARTFHVNPPIPKRWPAILYGTQGDFASYVLAGVGRLARLLGYKGFLIILDEMEKWSELNWIEQSRAGNLL